MVKLKMQVDNFNMMVRRVHEVSVTIHSKKEDISNVLQDYIEIIPIEDVKDCICQGFYKPNHCPIHGSKEK